MVTPARIRWRENNRERCRAYEAKWRRNNPEKHAAIVRRTVPQRRRRNLRWKWNYLRTHPCVDCSRRCSSKLDMRNFDFDHVRGETTYRIANLITQGRAIMAIEAEVEKCEVRCKPCHATRHAAGKAA